MNTGTKTTIFYITSPGKHLATRLHNLYPEAEVLQFSSKLVVEVWSHTRSLIFIMATGIVVRTIASLVKDKRTDPAVVVLDEKGKFAISLLSGHIGGANKISKEIADFLGGSAVITTASDVHNIPPRNLVLGIGCNRGTSAKEIEKAVRKTLAEHNLSFAGVTSIATIDQKGQEPGLVAFIRDYNLRMQTFTAEELNSVKGILKSEPVFKATGAIGVAEPAALLAAGTEKLLVPKQKAGNVTVAVAEQGLGGRGQGLGDWDSPLEKGVRGLSQKQESGGRRQEYPPLAGGRGVEYTQEAESKRQETKEKGRISIVGIGPGNIEHITPYAHEAIRSADVIVGYRTYLDLIRGLIEGKEVVATGMTQEIERCQKAVELAMAGRTVAVISGGDPGIYAMAGLVFEILKDYQSPVVKTPITDYQSPITNYRLPITNHQLPITDYQSLRVEIIPGISALNACAARLGAPLMHDFAVISLSDRLTPWELIEKRIESAAMSNFVAVLYNPKSMGRQKHINKAQAIFLRHRSVKTPVGIVKNAMRENERIIITNLGDMLNDDIDMQTTIIIGNSQTFVWKGWMITPRGYKKVDRLKTEGC